MLVGGELLAELPPSWDDVFKEQILPADGRHSEAGRLAGKPVEALPVGTPVPGHLDPPYAGDLDGCHDHRAAVGDVGDQHELKVVESGDGVRDPALALALDMLVKHEHKACAVDGDILPSWLRHVKVLARRVAPAAVVAREAQLGGQRLVAVR
ncbi:hypothetical protein D1007_51459 [Hordeum vulgare]|nr:hypothetical protein D1007_51459 [Hordeum vulgare]